MARFGHLLKSLRGHFPPGILPSVAHSAFAIVGALCSVCSTVLYIHLGATEETLWEHPYPLLGEGQR